MLRISTLIGFIAIALIAGGCAWQQGYLAAQGWQRNACYRLVEQTERDRCLARTNVTYDDYRRQAEPKKE